MGRGAHRRTRALTVDHDLVPGMLTQTGEADGVTSDPSGSSIAATVGQLVDTLREGDAGHEQTDGQRWYARNRPSAVATVSGVAFHLQAGTAGDASVDIHSLTGKCSSSAVLPIPLSNVF